MEIYKSTTKLKTDQEFKMVAGDGIQTYVSWERLLPYIGHAIGKTPRENIVGFVVDDSGIKVKLEHIIK